MEYAKVQKWLQKAVSKEEYRPALVRPAYLPKYGMTFATNGVRVHAVEGAHAGEVEGYPDVMEILEEHRPDVTAIWTVDTRDLRWLVRGLQWLAKAPREYHSGKKPIVSLTLQPDGPLGTGWIAADADTDRTFSFDLPGRVELDTEGVVEVNPEYLADALGLADDIKGTVVLRLDIPNPKVEQLKALWIQAEVENQKRLAVVMPVRSRAFENRRKPANSGAVFATA